ncbi:NUDIX domain-containing protein [Arthrobacter ginkgonis]|uniref:NUDIX domain-containing protein n=1 Tax=Arthrobacter ginkgonis TaxID=1630594 RepID=A0ABP7DBD9_9MICC
MPIPDFILALRAKIGTDPLWLPGVKAVVLRPGAPAADDGGEGEGGNDGPGNDGAGEVLLVRRADNGRWTLPAGILEPGEEPARGCVREVLEETGVSARVVRLAGVGTTDPVVYPNGDQAQYLDVVFGLEYVAGQARVNDDENTDVRWFPLEDLPDLPPKHLRALAWAVDPDPAPKFLT